MKGQLEDLARVLDLDSQDQDWGLVNADRARVAEFVAFFRANYDEHWSPWTVAEFVDLVMESACEAARVNPRFELEQIDGFVATAAPVAPQQFQYWTSRDWAVTPHLRTLGL